MKTTKTKTENERYNKENPRPAQAEDQKASSKVVEKSSDEHLRFERLQVGTTERERTEQVLEDRLKFETLLSELSAQFVNLPSDRIDSEIEETNV